MVPYNILLTNLLYYDYTMPMFYKSPGRALRDLRGINTGHYGKKVVHYEKKWHQILTR